MIFFPFDWFHCAPNEAEQKCWQSKFPKMPNDRVKLIGFTSKDEIAFADCVHVYFHQLRTQSTIPLECGKIQNQNCVISYICWVHTILIVMYSMRMYIVQRTPRSAIFTAAVIQSTKPINEKWNAFKIIYRRCAYRGHRLKWKARAMCL